MDVCLIYAPIVSWITDLLKRVPLLRQLDPRIVAILLSFAAPLTGFVVGPLPLGALILCALTTLAGAVATHELEPPWLDRTLSGRAEP